MENLGNLLKTDFVDRNCDYIENVVKQIEQEPISFNAKNKLILAVLEKGIAFGIAKGGYINECTRKKIEAASSKSYEKWLEKVLEDINENIATNKPKKKYKRKS